ncbi:ras-like GTP-binding protein Rho1 [Clavelina lepadiformis]|uniref:ras-like GTP-binding protein Rho1 n=1 Tax=Clavelina lepadiformis TaxID=159417 RepID=UPI004042C5B0
MSITYEQTEKIKCVVVGDGGSGKTSLLVVYVKGEFPEQYCPTVFDNYSAEVDIGEKKATLMLFDTAGQEDYDRLRPLFYDQVDVIIMCYDVNTHASFENVEIRWIPETRHFCPDALVVLVACKTDLRRALVENDVTSNDVDLIRLNKQRNILNHNRVITTEEGHELAERIKATAFIECSAKENENVNNVFLTSVQKFLLEAQKRKQSDCCRFL